MRFGYAVSPSQGATTFYSRTITWSFIEPGPGFVPESAATGIPDDLDVRLAAYGGDEARHGPVCVTRR